MLHRSRRNLAGVRNGAYQQKHPNSPEAVGVQMMLSVAIPTHRANQTAKAVLPSPGDRQGALPTTGRLRHQAPDWQMDSRVSSAQSRKSQCFST